MGDDTGDGATVCIESGRAGSSLLFVPLLFLEMGAELGGVEMYCEEVLVLALPLEFELKLPLAQELVVDVELLEPLRVIFGIRSGLVLDTDIEFAVVVAIGPYA